MSRRDGRETRRLGRPGVLRGVAVVGITAAVTLAAACSEEDTVDTIPPPRPGRTAPAQPLGPLPPTTSSIDATSAGTSP